MKSQLSSLDIYFLVKELSSLAGARLDNVYQIGERDMKISLRSRGTGLEGKGMEGGATAANETNELTEGKKELIITPRYLCLTRFEHEVPGKPSNLAMILRRHLGGGIVKSIEQHKFDRIVEITVEKRGKLILEFFSRGNVILVDESNIILAILEGQEWKDRTLKVGITYNYPPETPDIKTMSLIDFAVRVSTDKEMVKTLAADLGLGSTYANEVLSRAGVESNARSEKKIVDKVYAGLKDILGSKIDAQIVLEEITEGGGGYAIDVSPFEMKVYERNDKEKKTSFNEAVDEFFTNKRNEGEKTEATKDYKKELDRLTVVIGKQRENIEEQKKEIEEFKSAGDKIYASFQEIDAILRGMQEARTKGIKWMEYLAEKGLKVTDPAERKFDYNGIGLFVDKSVAENANAYYGKSKKAKSKLAGALSALRGSESEVRAIEGMKVKAEKRLEGGPVERHKPEWYEKFRWFVSSDGFLVIGGRDAATNEIIIKKHTEPNDLVFHSAVHGAPFFVVKNPENREIPDSTKRETAEAAASYSSAWMDEIGSVDVYAMTPEQVTKTPNSGEYLSRGAFVIRGEREWFKGTPLKLAMGFRVGEYAIAIGGPEGAVKSQTKYYTTIGVGSRKSGELAEEIKSAALRKANKEDGQKIKKVILGEIQRWIPAGKGMILK